MLLILLSKGSGLIAQGSEFKAQSSEFRVQSSKLKVQSSEFKVQSSKFRAQSSEFKVQGSVVDAVTKEKLAFVNIVINETGTLGTTTDIDGNFSISSKERINVLTFSFVGYEKKQIAVNDEKNVFVKLKPQNIQLSEIVIDGSNNPANRIIDSVYKYRDSNNPESLDSYYYKMYDNMGFTMDTSWMNVYDEIGNQLKNNDLLAMETVSEQYFLKPNKSMKNVLANKFSGSKSPVFIYLLESIQGVGFYDDLINIDTKKYVNPISKNSTNKYIFVLESAMMDEKNDSIFVISFRPYKNTNFNALKGTVTINSDKWAVQNIKASPAKQASTYNIEIQQLYEKVNDEFWFPKQLNTVIATYNREKLQNELKAKANDTVSYISVSLKGESNIPLLGIGKSYITDIEINKDIDKNIFDADFTINENAANADDIIKSYRYERLSDERLEATYKFVDSIFNDANINIDKISSSLTSILANEIPIGCVNLKFNDIMDYNIGNGYMLGLGLKTNNKISRTFSVGGYGNYWFKAKEANYGGNIDFKILKSKDMKMSLSYSHKFERLGDYGFKENKSVFNSENYKYLYVISTSLNNSLRFDYSTYLNKYLKGFIGFEVADKTVSKQWSIDNTQQTSRLSNIDFKLRIAFGEKFIKSKDGISVEGNANPVIWLSYQKNLKDVFESPYDFDKVEFLFRGRNDTRYLGETTLTLQLGYINGVAPVTELFNLYGTNAGKFEVYCTESFNTMRPDEFFCDKFGALYLSHNFRNLLMNFKKFHPEIIVVTNIALGNHAETQKLRNSETQKLYCESGIVVDNIINTGINKLGFGIFYHYGPYSYNQIKDNFVFKICLGIGL